MYAIGKGGAVAEGGGGLPGPGSPSIRGDINPHRFATRNFVHGNIGLVCINGKDHGGSKPGGIGDHPGGPGGSSID